MSMLAVNPAMAGLLVQVQPPEPNSILSYKLQAGVS
jgi:hypothetical protein